MHKFKIILSFCLLCYSCNLVESPPNDNKLDPDSPNYINPVPYDLKVQTVNDNTISLEWSYYSLNDEGFRVNINSIDQKDNKELIVRQNYHYVNISDLDTSKSYSLKVQAFAGNIFTNYSNSIDIKFQNYPSYYFSYNTILPNQTIDNFYWAKNDQYMAVENNGIVIYGVLFNQNVYKKSLTIESTSSNFSFQTMMSILL